MIDLKRLHQDLVRLETELWNTLDARLRAENGLPLTWYMVMRHLAERPGSRVQDVAHEFAITAGGTSKVIDRIEDAGYCRRRPHPNDRRSAIVELTSDGQDLVNRAEDVFGTELRKQIGSAASEQSLTQFAATLCALRAALSRGRHQTSTELGT